MNTKTAHRPCPVCNQTQVEILHQQRFVLPDGHPLPDHFDVVACPECGFVYADTSGTPEDYDDYYCRYSKYADQQTSTGGGGDAKDQKRLELTADAIAAQLPGPEARIVDIGCANGGLLGALKALGFSALLGVDPSPACVANTKRLFDVPASQGWLLDLPPESAPADLVVVSHVLEHVLDLRSAIEKVAGILSENGIVYVEVPDASRYAECIAAPFQDFNVEHINHFYASSLKNLMAACGFEALDVGTKTLEAAEGVDYPALFGFFRRACKTTADIRWIRDEQFRSSMDGYVRKSGEMLKGIDRRIAEVAAEPVFVWGTGQLTLKLLAETCLAQAPITAFVDGNPLNQGKHLRGIRILAPEELSSLPAQPIIIGTLLHHHAIELRIRDNLGLSNPVILLS
jgi:2-polyprenyl-3-methyl-5-hydroxy-6-metoxy-1,4-benzoquinol methylase